MRVKESGSVFRIDGREVGDGQPPYIIGEISANHNGDLKRALDTIKMIKASGADAVKLQTYTPDTMTIDSNNDDFKIKKGLWAGKTLFDLYGEAYTPYEWHKELFEYARDLKITCFSSPFDETAVDLLEDLNAPAYKIASFEVIDIPLIRYVARTGKPLIISTGMANINEIKEAVEVAQENGCHDLILLHCISGYPSPIEQSNIVTIPDLRERFDVLTGLSDHTLGTTVSVASIALGACVIEKHVTLSRDDKGPDSEFSLEPNELKQLCNSCRDAWWALGSVNYDLKPIEKDSMIFRRSIYVVKDISAGEKFSEENVRRIRPGYGLAPKYYNDILGKTSKIDLISGTALSWEVIGE